LCAGGFRTSSLSEMSMLWVFCLPSRTHLLTSVYPSFAASNLPHIQSMTYPVIRGNGKCSLQVSLNAV
jgi:hypothetical protein